jgi:hypothetical protein
MAGFGIISAEPPGSSTTVFVNFTSVLGNEAVRCAADASEDICDNCCFQSRECTRSS